MARCDAQYIGQVDAGILSVPHAGDGSLDCAGRPACVSPAHVGDGSLDCADRDLAHTGHPASISCAHVGACNIDQTVAPASALNVQTYDELGASTDDQVASSCQAAVGTPAMDQPAVGAPATDRPPAGNPAVGSHSQVATAKTARAKQGIPPAIRRE